MQKEVTIWYLELTDKKAFRPSTRRFGDIRVEEIKVPCPEFNRFFYTAIGGDWFWIDRLKWDYRQWLDWLEKAKVFCWAAYREGNPVGYFELEKHLDGSVEIAYFGVLSQFTGEGIGAFLLTKAVEQAWMLGARRLWLHTCSLDHPVAMDNYIKRGLKLYKQETSVMDLPAHTPGPWPGAHKKVKQQER